MKSLTHLVEIDLLRDGISLPVESGDIQSHYRNPPSPWLKSEMTDVL